MQEPALLHPFGRTELLPIASYLFPGALLMQGAIMIESTRRRVLDTLNSRYLYGRVVRGFLTCCHNVITLIFWNESSAFYDPSANTRLNI